MKLKGWFGGIGLIAAFLVFAPGLFSDSARAAFLYKSYVIRQVGGQEILCDPYIVQQDDYVLKIFRQRGEISHADFPDFLNIFTLVNPQVEDINRILPGQRIFIPLKKLEPGSVPDHDSGVVTIPFVTKTGVDDILKEHSQVYDVKRGDTVSKLLTARFGRYGSNDYLEALSLFMTMNPEVENIDLILTGQQLWLPDKAIQNELWYESLFDSNGEVAAGASGESEKASKKQKASSGATTGKARDEETLTTLAEAAGLLEARLYQKGTYYFPRSGQGDLQLDLASFPVLETRDGSRVLIASPEAGGGATPEMLSALKTFWKDLVVADLPTGADLPRALDAIVGSLTGGSISEERVLTDQGVKITLRTRWMIDAPGKTKGSLAIIPIKSMSERTSPTALEYLKTLGVEVKEVVLSDASAGTDSGEKTRVSYGQVPVLDASLDRQVFVRNFYGILGMNYQQNATVSFKYAGIQIQAVTNALNRADGHLILIDFNDLQGEAVSTLEKADFEVVRVPSEGPLSDLIPELLGAADMTCEADPTFTGSGESGSGYVTFFLPGFLALKGGTPKALLATVPVPDDLVRFFKEQEIDVVSLINVPKKTAAAE